MRPQPTSGPPTQRALLAILLLHAGQVVSTQRLIDLLGDERPPRTATHSIQIYVSARYADRFFRCCKRL